MKLLWSAALLLLLAGCQVKPTGPTLASGSLVARTQQQLPLPSQLPPYHELEQSFYLDGGAPQQSSQWRQLLRQIEASDLEQCQQIPWQQHLPVQLLNLSFYRYALACFRQHKDQANLTLFSQYQSYVQQGILATGDGKHGYSAFQIHSFTDAAELAGLAGMEIQDYRLELSANGNAMFYLLHLYDPAQDRLIVWYFDNQRFLHAVDGVPFPFIGLYNGWQNQLIPQSANSNAAMMTIMGYLEQINGRYRDAEKWYLQAIEQDSMQAAVYLAQLCTLQSLATPAERCQQMVVEAADKDYLPALSWLAYQHYLHSKAPDKLADIASMMAYINQRGGPGYAEISLSRFLFSKTFAPAEPAVGLKLLQQAAAQGEPNAAAMALLAQQELQPLAKPELLKQLQQLADTGSSEAAYLYVSEVMLQRDQLTPDWPRLQQYLQQSMQAWHPEAYFLFAYGLEQGWFSPTAGKTAAEQSWQSYQFAAERFYSRAMLRVGNAYRDGSLTTKNPERAAQWFLLCSRQGNVACAYNAGVMYDDGEDVEKDQDTAFRLFSYAVDQQYVPAMNRLALMYLFGVATDKNVEKAVQLLQQAADSGSLSANYYLGLLYFEGKYLPEDTHKAQQYLQRAKQHPKAAQLLEKLQQASKP